MTSLWFYDSIKNRLKWLLVSIIHLKVDFEEKKSIYLDIRTIRICWRPKMDNRNNITQLLVSRSFPSGTNFTSGIIPVLQYFLNCFFILLLKKLIKVQKVLKYLQKYKYVPFFKLHSTQKHYIKDLIRANVE